MNLKKHAETVFASLDVIYLRIFVNPISRDLHQKWTGMVHLGQHIWNNRIAVYPMVSHKNTKGFGKFRCKP
jgi:hypothetical protein